MVSVSVNQEVWTVCVGKSMSVSFNGYGSCQSMGMISHSMSVLTSLLSRGVCSVLRSVKQ